MEKLKSSALLMQLIQLDLSWTVSLQTGITTKLFYGFIFYTPAHEKRAPQCFCMQEMLTFVQSVCGNLLQSFCPCEVVPVQLDFFLFRWLIKTSPDLNVVAQRHNETGRFQHLVLKESVPIMRAHSAAIVQQNVEMLTILPHHRAETKHCYRNQVESHSRTVAVIMFMFWSDVFLWVNCASVHRPSRGEWTRPERGCSLERKSTSLRYRTHLNDFKCDSAAPGHQTLCSKSGSESPPTTAVTTWVQWDKRQVVPVVQSVSLKHHWGREHNMAAFKYPYY